MSIPLHFRDGPALGRRRTSSESDRRNAGGPRDGGRRRVGRSAHGLQRSGLRSNKAAALPLRLPHLRTIVLRIPEQTVSTARSSIEKCERFAIALLALALHGRYKAPLRRLHARELRVSGPGVLLLARGSIIRSHFICVGLWRKRKSGSGPILPAKGTTRRYLLWRCRSCSPSLIEKILKTVTNN